MIKKEKTNLQKEEKKEKGGKDDGCISCSLPQSEEGKDDVDREEEEEIDTRKTKLLIVLGLCLTIPIVIIEIFYGDYEESRIIDYILMALASPVQFLLGKPFYVRFYTGIRRKRIFTVSTLVVLSTSIAFIYSIIAIFIGQDVRFFEASASVLTIFTIGEYLESRVLQTTSQSIRKLLELKPKKATIIKRNPEGRDERKKEEVTINAEDVEVGDIVVVRPGETITADGIITYGDSSVDESMITGESIPVDKKIGDMVIGGTINKNGYLEFKTTKVGSHTVLANIIEMVERAKTSKPSIQRLADQAARYFIPIVISIATASSIYWLLFAHHSIHFAVTIFATILVVSCPCALGIATPMVVSLGVGRATREGVLIKGGEYLEKLATIDTVVFDKTGTLTKGKPEVTDIIPNETLSFMKADVLQLAYSVENKSEHPIAQAIVRKARAEEISALEVSRFSTITGLGATALYQEDKNIFVGSPRIKNNEQIIGNITQLEEEERHQQTIVSSNLESEITMLESDGKTAVAVYFENKLVGVIGIADTLRDNARNVIDIIKKSGKDVILMTGDNERTANAIAIKLGITNVLAQISPQIKAQQIAKLQNQQGRKVAMVGDGINDAPALTQADIGIAMGSGTDIAQTSGHVILIRNDLAGVIHASGIGQFAIKKIKQNLVISFAYNSLTIPIAAGLLYGVTNSLVLTPALAALGWIISDSLVFGNSLLIRRYDKT